MFAQHAFEQIFATKYLIISKCNLVKKASNLSALEI